MSSLLRLLPHRPAHPVTSQNRRMVPHVRPRDKQRTRCSEPGEDKELVELALGILSTTETAAEVASKSVR